MSRSQTSEVAWREIRTRARTNAFRIITGILVLAAVAGPIVLSLWPDGDDHLREVSIGLVQVDDGLAAQILLLSEGVLDVSIEDLSGEAREDVNDLLSAGDLIVVIESGPTLAWDVDRDIEVAAVVEMAIQQQELIVRGDALGLEEDEIDLLMTPVVVGERYVDPSDEPADVARVVAFIGLMVTFMLPQIYGQLALLSVVEEKSSRVVEILLSHLKPRTLLLGKVIGLCSLASLQILVVTAGLTAALLATDSVDIPTSVWQFLPIVLISVLGGLAIYNTFFALLGSLISRQEDAAQIIAPVLIPLLGGFFAAQSVIASGKAGPLARVLTLFPLTAPMLLPVRVAMDTISAGEVALSLGLLALAVWGLIRLAGRVYEFTLLQTGARIGWADLIRLSRGASLD